MNLDCWYRTFKAHGYIDSNAPLPSDDMALIKQIEEARKSPILEFDLESIDSGHSYMHLLVRIDCFLGDDLALRRIKSNAKEGEGTVTVEFEWQDKLYQWTFEQTADWVSDEFLENVYSLVAEHTPGRLVALPCSDPYIYLVYLPAAIDAELGRC